MSQSVSKRVCGKSFEPPKLYFLFYFTLENTWSILDMKHSSWGNFPKCERCFVAVGDEVILRYENKDCAAVLISNSDSLEVLYERKATLLKKMDQVRFDPSRSFLSEINHSKDSIVSDVTPTNPSIPPEVVNDESTPVYEAANATESQKDRRSESVSNGSGDSEEENDTLPPTTETQTNSDVVNLQKETLSVLKKLNASLERRCPENRSVRLLLAKHLTGAVQSSTSAPQLTPNVPKEQLLCPRTNENLMDIVGSSSSKFASNIARKIFSEEELINGMLEPQRDSTRVQLEKSRVDLIKSCVLLRFPGEDWTVVRESVNQLGRDIKKKETTGRHSVSLDWTGSE